MIVYPYNLLSHNSRGNTKYSSNCLLAVDAKEPILYNTI